MTTKAVTDGELRKPRDQDAITAVGRNSGVISCHDVMLVAREKYRSGLEPEMNFFGARWGHGNPMPIANPCRATT